MIYFDEDTMFCFAGVVEMDDSYNAAIAIADPFFALKPEAREVQIKAWIELLQGCLDEEFMVELSGETDQGEMAIIVSQDVVELREIPDNVVEFKTDEQGE